MQGKTWTQSLIGWVQIPTVPLTSYAAVGKSLNLFDLSFLVYKMEALTFTFLGGKSEMR